MLGRENDVLVCVGSILRPSNSHLDPWQKGNCICRGKANEKGFGQLAKVVLAAEIVVKKGVLLCPHRL
jgi:hypothetical protein